jgi:hypothetical protein
MHVTIQVADPGTKKIQIETVKLLPDFKELPRDPEWEATETKIAVHCCRNLQPPEPD